jgi:hypothetical protein
MNDVRIQFKLNQHCEDMLSYVNRLGDNKPVSGKPKKISPQGERRLVRLAISNRFSSARCLLEIWNAGQPQNVRIGLTTARLILKKYNIRGCTAAKKLKLAKNTRKVRRKWCRERRNRTVDEWQKILFTDEVRFGFLSDGRIHVWRRPGEKYHPSCTIPRSSNRRSVMFWGIIGSTGVGSLLRCSNRMTSSEYIKVLDAAAVSVAGDFQNFFMDDNAPIHRARNVIQWKLQYNIPLEEWPPNSPDMNPIENVWGYMKKKLNALVPRLSSVYDLEKEVHKLWNEMPSAFISRLYCGMPNRIKLCLKAHGYPIRY